MWPDRLPYQGRCDKQTPAGWAGAFSSWMRQGRDVFGYFNNDEAGHAVRNAQELAGTLGSCDPRAVHGNAYFSGFSGINSSGGAMGSPVSREV